MLINLFIKFRKDSLEAPLSIPYLVSLGLERFHLVLDHSALLLVHFAVLSQLLHLEAQRLVLIQELTNTRIFCQFSFNFKSMLH